MPRTEPLPIAHDGDPARDLLRERSQAARAVELQDAVGEPPISDRIGPERGFAKLPVEEDPQRLVIRSLQRAWVRGDPFRSGDGRARGTDVAERRDECDCNGG